MTSRLHSLAAGTLAMLALGIGPARAANSNPSVGFSGPVTNGTNFYTNPAAKYFEFKLYSLSNYAGFSGRLLSSVRTASNWTRIYSNDTLAFSVAPFATVGTDTTPKNFPIHGIRFDPTNGRLFGTPTTNFYLTISLGALQVVSTNITSRITNVLVFSNNAVTETTNGPLTSSFTNTNSTIGYRFAFYSNPAVIFTQTNLGVNTTNLLPSTNNNTDQANYYFLLSGPGDLRDDFDINLPKAVWHTETNNGPIRLVVSNAGVVTLVVGNARDADGLWGGASRTFSVLVTNPAPAGFAFQTNTNASPFTKTNLNYLESTPLILSQAGVSNTLVFSLNRPDAGRLFRSNGLAFVQALSASGTLTVEAVRPSTAMSSAVTSSLAINLSKRTSEISWGFPFFTNATFTNTHPSVTSLFLSATSSSRARVVFTTTNAHASILNQRNLLFSNETDIEVVATTVGENTALWVPAAPKTNRVKIVLSNPAAPVFTSTNQQGGTVDTLFSYTLTAAASNTNAFPVTFAATNLPAGISFANGNQLSGTPTQPGLYRIQLTASNAGGMTTNILTSVITPSSPFSGTNAWTHRVALGSGTNTNGTYVLADLPSGIGLATNTSDSAPPVLLLTNANTNPASANWFAGITNLSVVFSNTQTNLTSPVTLNVRPPAPTLAISSSVTGTAGLLLSVTGTVTPPNLTVLPGYPVVFLSSNLPSGLVLNPTSGVISGRPLQGGLLASFVWVSNSVGTSPASNVTFHIQPQAGTPMELPLASLFDPAPGVGTYQVSPAIPGLTLNATSGVWSGTPLAVGAVPVQVIFTDSGGARTNNYELNLAPPVPVVQLPARMVTARVRQAVLVQPWVTGPGWGWAGADSLVGRAPGPAWTNHLVIGGAPVSLASNSEGRLISSLGGTSFTNNQSNNELFLLWRGEPPASWPWQALLRLRMAVPLTNGTAETFLGAFRAQAAYPNDFYGNHAEGGLLSSTGTGVVPYFRYEDGNGQTNGNLGPVGTNEVIFRLKYDTNGQTLGVAVNTNPLMNTFVALQSQTNLGTAWDITNQIASFRVWFGGSFSNQPVRGGQVLARSFAVLPQGVTFSATGLPPGLSIDSLTGTISGSPTRAGRFSVTVTAASSSGAGQAGLTFLVSP